MSTDLAVSLVSVLGSITVALISYRAALNGTRRAAGESMQLIAWRLQQLENRVQAHNHLVERMIAAEKSISALEARVNRE
ncbi:MAG: hypothetical protein IKP40_08460 [Clostridia bacterium]|nr:hypothetical protein [Clostridia bacterium]